MVIRRWEQLSGADMTKDELDWLTDTLLEQKISEPQLKLAALYIIWHPEGPVRFKRLVPANFFPKPEQIAEVHKCMDYLKHQTESSERRGYHRGKLDGMHEERQRFEASIEYRRLLERTATAAELDARRIHLESREAAVAEELEAIVELRTELDVLMRQAMDVAEEKPTEQNKRRRDRMVSVGAKLNQIMEKHGR